MTKTAILLLIIGTIAFLATSSQPIGNPDAYTALYHSKIRQFTVQQQVLLHTMEAGDLSAPADMEKISLQIGLARDKMKGIDFWLRYLDPIGYKKINGPLPVEWETEVFEKFEKPYKRIGAGLTLAALYLEEPVCEKDSLLQLIQASIAATEGYHADSTTKVLPDFGHFYFCNRLFLLNLAAIYTTGFECPDSERIIPELRFMMDQVQEIYRAYDISFPERKLSPDYWNKYQEALHFVQTQPDEAAKFDHFNFIRLYVNPLFKLNQESIRRYEIFSGSFVDYSLNNEAKSIFDKDLYFGQNDKGLFLRVKDPKTLAEIEAVGKLLFYDPILSGNNLRSCASCHKSDAYFTDTISTTALQYNRTDHLTRNTPSLINVSYNHLLMLDGNHISLQNQAKAVLNNPLELNNDPSTLLKKILSCQEYKTAFTNLLQETPQESEITLSHIISAITTYYHKFSLSYAPFDDAMDRNYALSESEQRGFNLFMNKAQCATCHFAPQFNGVKPPYVGSEFEVLGVPADKQYHKLSADEGRYTVNPAFETLHAFRTGSLRNIALTKPYMHNGVFTTLEEVIDFYDSGGGVGNGLQLENQTLASDSLHLTPLEKKDLITFLNTLNEKIPFETPPAKLPASRTKSLNARKLGGEY